MSRLFRKPPSRVVLSCLFFIGVLNLSLGAVGPGVYTLETGPSLKEFIPLPLLWASPVWEASYRHGTSSITVYVIDSPYFYLRGATPMTCPGLQAQEIVREDQRYVFLSKRFLFEFPREFLYSCEFLTQFQTGWNYLQSVSYNRGLITLPVKVEINPTTK